MKKKIDMSENKFTILGTIIIFLIFLSVYVYALFYLHNVKMEVEAYKQRNYIQYEIITKEL